MPSDSATFDRGRSPDKNSSTASRRNSSGYFDGRPHPGSSFLCTRARRKRCPSQRGNITAAGTGAGGRQRLLVDDLGGDVAEFAVFVLGLLRQHLERFVGGVVQGLREDQLRFPDQVPRASAARRCSTSARNDGKSSRSAAKSACTSQRVRPLNLVDANLLTASSDCGLQHRLSTTEVRCPCHVTLPTRQARWHLTEAHFLRWAEPHRPSTQRHLPCASRRRLPRRQGESSVSSNRTASPALCQQRLNLDPLSSGES